MKLSIKSKKVEVQDYLYRFVYFRGEFFKDRDMFNLNEIMRKAQSMTWKALGISEFNLVELTFLVEDRFRISLSYDEVLKAKVVRDYIILILKKMLNNVYGKGGLVNEHV